MQYSDTIINNWINGNKTEVFKDIKENLDNNNNIFINIKEYLKEYYNNYEDIFIDIVIDYHNYLIIL